MSVSQVITEQKGACVGVLWLCVFTDHLGKGPEKNESGRICPRALVSLLEWLCNGMCLCLCKKMEDNTYKAILQNCSKAQSAVTPFSPGLCILQVDQPTTPREASDSAALHSLQVTCGYRSLSLTQCNLGVKYPIFSFISNTLNKI